MQRYFIAPEQMTERQIEITGNDVHHLIHVLRAKEGETIIGSNGQGKDVEAKIIRIDSDAVYAEVIRTFNRSSELPIAVTVAQGLPKGDKMDWVIQKGTEIGASCFIPLQTKRTIVQFTEQKKSKKRDRWQRIAKEAAEQAHRSLIPQVEPFLSWPQLLQKTQQYDLALLAYEQESNETLYQILKNCQTAASLLIVVGPEGGFDEQEVQQATDAGICTISLGKRILRTETAAMHTLSCMAYHFEQVAVD